MTQNDIVRLCSRAPPPSPTPSEHTHTPPPASVCPTPRLSKLPARHELPGSSHSGMPQAQPGPGRSVAR